MQYYVSGMGAAVEKSDVFEELEHIIGAEAANRFVDFYSGASIYIPKNIITERTYKKIRDEFKNGASYRELAVRYGYTQRHIRRIVHTRRVGR
jgi:Mor family transcriptional regulator